MPRQLTLGQIIDRALRKIGAYSINDTGPQPGEVEEARYWLDMVVGHVTASQRTWWLVPQTIEFALPEGEESFDLEAAAGAAWPDDGVQFPISASVIAPNSETEQPVEIGRRSDYEAIQRKDTPGRPCLVYIDRTREPRAYVHPVPAMEGFRLRLVAQTFVEDLTPDLRPSTNFRIGSIREAWNLYLVTALAALIGDGPVRKLPKDEVDSLKRDAAGMLSDLYAYDNHEQANEPRRVAYYDF